MNVIFDIVLAAALIVVISLGVIFIGIATAMEPENDCVFCPMWGKTYTDNEGVEKSFCDNCSKRMVK